MPTDIKQAAPYFSPITSLSVVSTRCRLGGPALLIGAFASTASVDAIQTSMALWKRPRLLSDTSQPQRAEFVIVPCVAESHSEPMDSHAREQAVCKHLQRLNPNRVARQVLNHVRVFGEIDTSDRQREEITSQAMERLYSDDGVAPFNTTRRSEFIGTLIDLCYTFALEHTLYGAIHIFDSYMLTCVRDGAVPSTCVQECTRGLLIVSMSLACKMFETATYIYADSLVGQWLDWTPARRLLCIDKKLCDEKTVSKLEWHVFECLQWSIPRVGDTVSALDIGLYR